MLGLVVLLHRHGLKHEVLLQSFLNSPKRSILLKQRILPFCISFPFQREVLYFLEECFEALPLTLSQADFLSLLKRGKDVIQSMLIYFLHFGLCQQLVVVLCPLSLICLQDLHHLPLLLLVYLGVFQKGFYLCLKELFSAEQVVSLVMVTRTVPDFALGAGVLWIGLFADDAFMFVGVGITGEVLELKLVILLLIGLVNLLYEGIAGLVEVGGSELCLIVLVKMLEGVEEALVSLGLKGFNDVHSIIKLCNQDMATSAMRMMRKKQREVGLSFLRDSMLTSPSSYCLS